MSSLQVPELRLPAGDGGGGNNRGTAPLLLVPQSNVPRRRHSWICGAIYIDMALHYEEPGGKHR